MLFTDTPLARQFQYVINLHLECYPLLEIPDLYKLVHQAALGNAHLTADLATATRQIQLELETAADTFLEPLVETITPDSTLIRVNLASFKVFQLNPELLAAAMLSSARQFQASPARLHDYWQVVELTAPQQQRRFTRAKLQAYFKPLVAQGFPARQHSETYRRVYRPAYRVIMAEFLAGVTG